MGSAQGARECNQRLPPLPASAIIALNYFDTKEARPMERRVVVTGMGAVSPLGLDVPTLWQGVKEARSVFGPVTLCDT